MSVCVYPMCRGVHRGQRRVSDFLELKLEVAVSCPTWSLGSELRSTGGVGRVPNCSAILLISRILFCSLLCLFVCFEMGSQYTPWYCPQNHKLCASSSKYCDCGYECVWLTEVLFSSNAGDAIQGFMRGRHAITETHPQDFVSTRQG